MISVALLSKWHVHAQDYARQANEHPELVIKQVWDENPERGEAWSKELDVSFEADLNKVLENPAIDAVIVTTPTHLHKEVMMAAAKNGKHIFTEKVLALSVEECKAIYKEVEAAGVKLVVSLPRLCDAPYLYAQEALDKGVLGDLTTIRCRLAHDGAIPREGETEGWLPAHFFDPVTCGGGALIDLGAHPIYLTNRLAGPAKTLSASLSSFYDYPVDDHSVVIVDYVSGAQGIIEAGFVSKGSPFTLELYGTKGSLFVHDDQVQLNLGGNRLITKEELPDPLSYPMLQWVEAILRDEKPTITKDDVIQLTKINEAAALSHREGKRVTLL